MRAGAIATGVLLTALAIGLAAGERRWPLRPTTESGPRRVRRNLAVAAVAALTVGCLEGPLVKPLSRRVQVRGWGLLPRLRLAEPVRLALGVALMDYTLYLWHVLLHRNRFLWRLHAPHHADLDLDASTALRFHFAELVASVPWRVGQVVLIGADPRVLDAWQKFTVACILFHHSNLRLPRPVENAVGLLLATPRMHGIHHSKVAEERDSNWSSGLSVWDRLHGTLRWTPPQSEITIGLSEVRSPRRVSLSAVLTMPFVGPGPA